MLGAYENNPTIRNQMNTVYLFYNGDDIHVPDEREYCKWNEYKNPDSAKMAWVCADSWFRHGWTVKRLRCGNRNASFDGRLARSPYPYNDFLRELHGAMTDDVLQRAAFTTSDVVNNGFAPMTDLISSQDYICLNHSFTMAAGIVTLIAISDMLTVLHAYDRSFDQYMQVPGMPCDEHVLRHLYPRNKYRCLDLMCPPMANDRPLVHYSRSCLQHLDVALNRANPYSF